MKAIQRFYNGKYFNLFLFLFFFIVPVLLYMDYFLQDQLILSGDGAMSFAIKSIIPEAVMQGELPLWNKYLQNGVPYMSDVWYNALYPINVICSLLPLKLSVYCYYVIHMAIGAFFMYLFLKELRCKKPIAMCVALLYELSIHLGGFRKNHIVIIACIIYLPVILYLLQKYLNTSKRSWLAFSACAMAMQFYAAFVQDVVYTDIIVFFYFLVSAVHNKIKAKRLFADMGIWIGIYIGLICMQLLPTLELLGYYSQSGASETSIEVFKSYSIHFAKLPMMIFPKMFGTDIFASFGVGVSSGLDIEIFLGVVPCFILFVGAIKYYKSFQIKLCLLMVALAFVYSANAHIPFLSKLLYNIPVIREFRVPSRMLFVFVFFGYALVGITVNKLWEDREWLKLKKYAVAFTGIAVLVAAISLMVRIQQGGNGEFLNLSEISAVLKQEYVNSWEYFVQAFLSGIINCIIITSCCFVMRYLSSHIGKNTLGFATLTLLLVLSLADTLPYTRMTSPSPTEELLMDDTSKSVRGTIGYGKMWDAYPPEEILSKNKYSFNRNMPKQIPLINSYIAFNNPNIYKLFTLGAKMPLNATGAMLGSVNPKENLYYQNGLLSMLGIKYVLDDYDLLKNENAVYNIKGSPSVFLYENEVHIPASELSVQEWPIMPKPHTPYKIEFDAIVQEIPELFYFDFAGGPIYDQAKQIDLKTGRAHYVAYILSGDTSTAINPQARFIAITDQPIEIYNFACTELAYERTEQVYKKYLNDGENMFYENTNARDILFVPSRVESVSSFDDLYANQLLYDLRDTSYIQNHPGMDLQGANTSIDVEYFKTNEIKASVSSDVASFINFSQNYYPGWKAYVNGNETPVYMVNGLIQGIEVPAGESVVVFRFTAPMLLLGAIITLLTLSFVIYLFILNTLPLTDGRGASVKRS